MYAMSNLEERAKKLLMRNFEATGKRYICPSWPHYPWQWGWDSCFHAIACAHLGMNDLAKNEIAKLFSVQVREGVRKGFIPHQIYWKNVISWTKRAHLDVERFFIKDGCLKQARLWRSRYLRKPYVALMTQIFFMNTQTSLLIFICIFNFGAILIAMG